MPSAPTEDPFVLFSPAADARAERKERMLCRQAFEALSMALPASREALLSDCWVIDVEPAPDASRLCVVVGVPAGTSAEAVTERLARAAGALRAEVAEAISRKRTPTLVFRVVPTQAGEGDDDAWEDLP